MLRRVLPLLLTAFLLGASAPASAEGDFIDIIKLSGPLDERAVDFAIETIQEVAPTSELIILQLDSQATLTTKLELLIDVVAEPAAPLAVWVGPETAVAYGGAVELLAVAPVRLAAPGVKIGAAEPVAFADVGIISGVDRAAILAATAVDVATGRISILEPIPGLVDEVLPALNSVVQALDGRTVTVGDEERTLVVTEPFDDGGEIRRRPIETRFHEPGFVDRALRLSLSPAVAYLFLLVGLVVAAFEFYAAGVGVAAAVSVLALGLGGYGLSELPVNWWGVLLGLAGFGLYLYDFQRQQMRIASVAGTLALIFGGRYFVPESPQLSMTWLSAITITLGIAAFFLFGMTTVVRARFSTPTIGRDHLIGRRGRAETAVSPEGVVVVDGARWRANSARVSGIEAGDEVVVAAVSGFVLDVDPVEEQ
ncbi:MAG: NfeD family protein [Acidimicrobiia bacterium]